MKNKTILLGLNELNFDYIKFYIDQGLLPNFKKVFDIQTPIETTSENHYKFLEPWIQWASVHTGKTYEEHKIFRLGDIVDRPELVQIFEELENEGLLIGAVSPFNADNRLRNPAFFVPDPWTITKPSGNWIVKALYLAVHQSVNDNAKSKLNFKSIISLGLGLFLYVPMSRWSHYVKKILNVKKPGFKALILDSLLADVHLTLWKKYKPDFSNLFLNSGAHIQHHYLFNSKAYNGDIKNPDWYCQEGYDPLIHILSEYDIQIGKLLNLNNVKLLVATGLHQQPHEHLTFYWRLKEHEKFAKNIGVKRFKEILPRMSRDFLIKFDNEIDAANAENLLNSFYASKDDIKLFEVDNRGKSLFVELIYPNDILEKDSIYSKDSKFKLNNFKSFISFVAIKNGEHNGIGYLTSNFDLKAEKKINLIALKAIIKKVALSKD
ncbi:hypothetical protein OD91_0734 [Lutibacter sp. Hel_I_33_5]|uniref:hypothetical protein n=1 Tax=Lutibacter sp. Hel_I_33_5 TaxID=1566289 RepID=UPI0011A7B9A7|nr:hypothetical protein [Lutibacter sp. Hel_I_33_5]TVZ55486.1 hypothetical protein OD91_0734 [Lutibacter sp. Hel_I_33_5]